jgi:hypothetical protein
MTQIITKINNQIINQIIRQMPWARRPGACAAPGPAARGASVVPGPARARTSARLITSHESDKGCSRLGTELS